MYGTLMGILAVFGQFDENWKTLEYENRWKHFPKVMGLHSPFPLRQAVLTGNRLYALDVEGFGGSPYLQLNAVSLNSNEHKRYMLPGMVSGGYLGYPYCWAIDKRTGSVNYLAMGPSSVSTYVLDSQGDAGFAQVDFEFLELLSEEMLKTSHPWNDWIEKEGWRKITFDTFLLRPRFDSYLREGKLKGGAKPRHIISAAYSLRVWFRESLVWFHRLPYDFESIDCYFLKETLVKLYAPWTLETLSKGDKEYYEQMRTKRREWCVSNETPDKRRGDDLLTWVPCGVHGPFHVVRLSGNDYVVDRRGDVYRIEGKAKAPRKIGHLEHWPNWGETGVGHLFIAV